MAGHGAPAVRKKMQLLFVMLLCPALMALGVSLTELTAHQFLARRPLTKGAGAVEPAAKLGAGFPSGGVPGCSMVVGLPWRQGWRQLPLPGWNPALAGLHLCLTVTGPAD